MAEEYKPIPVVAAKEMAERFDKAIVIVLAWDRKFGVLHTTTYGEKLEEKHWAATGGEIASAALGASQNKVMFEDFRKGKNENNV